MIRFFIRLFTKFFVNFFAQRPCSYQHLISHSQKGLGTTKPTICRTLCASVCSERRRANTCEIPPFFKGTDVSFSMLKKWNGLKAIWRLLGSLWNLHVKRFLKAVAKNWFTETVFVGALSGVRAFRIMHRLKQQLKLSSEGSATPITAPIQTKSGMSLRLKLIRQQLPKTIPLKRKHDGRFESCSGCSYFFAII